MDICIPVTQDWGLESPVSAHFGLAPLLMVVNTENGNCRAVLNRNHNYLHSLCQPLLSLAGKHMDGMIVGGIGMGALEKIQAAHINVYLSEFTTVAATVAAYNAGRLKLVTPQTACCLRGKGARPCSGNPCSSSLEGGRSRR
ncbi:MAG: NifB/NifX family molybdenum-iron cluster-binding protein [Acidobacteriota bacterium]|jgi:predicted Fe-Mo cluster-binding NifX family protein